MTTRTPRKFFDELRKKDFWDLSIPVNNIREQKELLEEPHPASFMGGDPCPIPKKFQELCEALGKYMEGGEREKRVLEKSWSEALGVLSEKGDWWEDETEWWWERYVEDKNREERTYIKDDRHRHQDWAYNKRLALRYNYMKLHEAS